MEIPKGYSRWDGSYKNYTKDCNSCPFYREIKEHELCGWGVAFKYLVREQERLRKCEIKNREHGQQNFIPSVIYLDEIIEVNN